MVAWVIVGMAVALAVLVAWRRPGLARSVLSQWRTWKEAIFLLVGLVTTYYALTSGVWYLIVLGAVGVAFAVWAVWFSDPLEPLIGGIR